MIHELETNYTKKILALTSQPGGPIKEQSIPEESDFEVQQDLVTEFT